MASRFGNYTLEERLAVGGMGELYLASTSSDRPLSVVKILHRDFMDNPEYVAMFEDEGKIGARLAHPNIVGVHETGRVDETPFIVFEFIDGENLRTVLNACAQVGMRIPPEIAVRIVVGVLLGLDHAHRVRDESGRLLNLVHRDLSPDNIVLSWDGEPKILDFGIAKAEGRSTQTQVGILKGKSQYMAPEQAKAAPVDQRTDLFCAGVVLLELLTGKKRFDFDDGLRQILAAQEWKPHAPSDIVPGLPVELDAIALKSMERAPENRFQSAEQFAAALTRMLQTGMLPRSEPIASFLRRLFPGRVKHAGLGASSELTLLPRGMETTSPRTPAPTVKKPSAFDEERDDERATVLGAKKLDREDERSTALGARKSALEDDPTSTREAAPFDDSDTDGNTRTAAAAIFDDSDTDRTERPTVLKDRQPVGGIGDEETDERVTARSGERRGESDRPTDPAVPPPIIRPPGSTPRAMPSSSAFKLEIAEDEGVYDDFDLPGPPPKGKSEIRKIPAAVPIKKRKSRAAVRFLLFFAFVVAGVTALASYRETLERVPAIAAAMQRVGLGSPTPEPTPTPPILVIATNGVAASPAESATATPAPIASATPASTATGKPTPAPKLGGAETPPPGTASIFVSSEPSGFPILVDGRATGKKTSATIYVQPGPHVISVEAPGYRDWEFGDTFKAGDTVTIPARLIRE